MRTFRLLAVSLAVLMGGVALADERRHISLGIASLPSSDNLRAGRQFGEIVAGKSSARIRITVATDERLGPDASVFEAVRKGKVDMALVNTAVMIRSHPSVGILNLPFVFNDEDEADQLLDGLFGGKLLSAIGAGEEVVGLAFWGEGFRVLTNNKRPFIAAADISGLKLLVMSNPISVNTFQALGAQIFPGSCRLRSALLLETGEVDGFDNPFGYVEQGYPSEAQPYLTLSRHMYMSDVLLMNRRSWDALTVPEQTIIAVAAAEARSFHRNAVRAQVARTLVILKKAGTKVNVISTAALADLRERVQPIVEKYGTEFNESLSKEMLQELAKMRGAAVVGKGTRARLPHIDSRR